MRKTSRLTCSTVCIVLVLSSMITAAGAQEIRSGHLPSLPQRSETLFADDSPLLGNLPDALSFTYSIPDQRFLLPTRLVTPLNVGSEQPLTWTVTTSGGWFSVAPLAGPTPASFQITPTVSGTGLTTSYTGFVTVTVTDPPSTPGSPHRIDLSLRVIYTKLTTIYVPIAVRLPTPLPRYPNDPFYSVQWALEQIEAPAAWGYSTGQGTLIAIIDTGTDLDHPDLADKVRTDIDYDFINDDDTADDDHSHGTHVSGSAAATTNNGTGIAGLGWEAMILPIKVLDSQGDGDSADLAQAIRYAADHGADVINMSLGGPVDCPLAVQEAADYAHARGVVLVAASGNHGGSDGPNAEMFPANCQHVLGVGATTINDAIGSYSNYGAHVSVVAPGSGIYSTWTGGSYVNDSGTSMATPHVAGLAALVMAHYPAYTPDEIASALLDNADDLGEAGWDEYYGCGRINGSNSLRFGKAGSSPLCLEGIGSWPAAFKGETTENPTQTLFQPGEIVVSLRPGTNEQMIFRRYMVSGHFLPQADVWWLRVPVGSEQAVLARLFEDPGVAYAELNYRVSAQ
jgi:hypothetical protein